MGTSEQQRTRHGGEEGVRSNERTAAGTRPAYDSESAGVCTAILAAATHQRRAGVVSPAHVVQLQRTAGNAIVVQRILAHRVEYQHNSKVDTNDKGHVTGLLAPIDISFGDETHSEYFASERNEDQLTGLRTIHWEMDDDWWAAAYYHSYKGPKPRKTARPWLTRIKGASCGKRACI